MHDNAAAVTPRTTSRPWLERVALLFQRAPGAPVAAPKTRSVERHSVHVSRRGNDTPGPKTPTCCDVRYCGAARTQGHSSERIAKQRSVARGCDTAATLRDRLIKRPSSPPRPSKPWWPFANIQEARAGENVVAWVGPARDDQPAGRGAPPGAGASSPALLLGCPARGGRADARTRHEGDLRQPAGAPQARPAGRPGVAALAEDLPAAEPLLAGAGARAARLPAGQTPVTKGRRH
jgi:hypothetical protein